MKSGRGSSVLPSGSSPRVSPALDKPSGVMVQLCTRKDDVGNVPSLSETECARNTECAKLPGQKTCYTLEKNELPEPNILLARNCPHEA